MTRPVVRCLLALSAMCLLSASVASAGTVYVPLPGVPSVGNRQYEVQVTITNNLAQTRATNSFLIQTGQDGTKRTGTATPVQVPAGQSIVLKPDKAARGLLELSGPTGFQYSARLVGLGDAAGLGVELPVITSENLGPAGGRLVLHGLLTKGALAAGLTVVNLGHQASSCVLEARRPDGSVLVPGIAISVPALGQHFFGNVLGPIAGAAGVADVRVSATCTREFYVYALVADGANGGLAVLTPAASGASTLVPPGTVTVPPPAACPAGSSCFSVAGLVHKPTRGNEYHRVTPFRPPVGTYSKVRLQMDVTHGGWSNVNPGAQHEIFWFVQNNNKDMIGYTSLRGPGKQLALLRHGFNQTHGEKSKVLEAFDAKPGTRYRYDYLYDAAARQIVLSIQENGAEVLRLTDTPNIRSITVAEKDLFLVDLSFPLTSNLEEAPSYDWLYENLLVEFIP